MQLTQLAPPADLARWVHSFRRYRFTPADAAGFSLLPGTGAELWLRCGGSLQAGNRPLDSGVLCLRQARLALRQQDLDVFAVRLRAGALPCFSATPMSALVDRYAPFAALWRAREAAAFAAIARCDDFAAQCALAARLLQRQLRPEPLLDAMQQLAGTIYEQHAGFRLADYAERAGQPRRTLSQAFRQTQGIGAKYYHRLCRFERFLRDGLYHDNAPLAVLALDNGYYDQAHLSRDVGLLARVSPGLLLRRPAARLFYSPRPA